MDLIRSLVRSIKVGGALILSGILSESFANIERAVSGVDVRIEDVKRDGDWVAILAFKH